MVCGGGKGVWCVVGVCLIGVWCVVGVCLIGVGECGVWWGLRGVVCGGSVF